MLDVIVVSIITNITNQIEFNFSKNAKILFIQRECSTTDDIVRDNVTDLDKIVDLVRCAYSWVLRKLENI